MKNRLPALAKRVEFEEAINSPQQFLVVMGQTGSGKSTQLVQYLADMPAFTGQSVSPFFTVKRMFVSEPKCRSFKKNSADIELWTLFFSFVAVSSQDTGIIDSAPDCVRSNYLVLSLFIYGG